MFKKILAMFKKSSIAPISIPSKSSKPRKKVESTRIGELGEYKINIQLDQLPKDCKYLSDLMVRNSKSRTGFSQIDHVVISPFGLFVIETKNYNGEIKGLRDDTYWTVNNRFKMYNPLKQNYGHIKALESTIKGNPDLIFVSMISFTMRCRFSIDPSLRNIESNELIVYDVELSEFISRKILRMKAVLKKSILQDSDVMNLFNMIKKANITDPALRAEHVEKIKRK
ncbi:nuclease-related domain-containing protein [Paenibacillus agricola]|uniref:NERD domain-containing protein n=1 Tax=Paenibacillus agricola TaxID=2716264 RepID=A0ABX0JLG8_9BACL|nr:nuclease-related domain-containing protein [Paenibacillus agricola]NHN34860.1 NERD domain-containing protein [Paenibacillus agricola]